MAKAPRSAAATLSIRLLKARIQVDDMFRENANYDEVATESPPGSRLFISSSRGHPSWMLLLADLTTYEPDLWTQSSSAVLAVPVTDQAGEQRHFILCFGGGHFLIDPSKIERNFGLRVVLNKVSRRNLRSLDSATLDATVFQRRTQASRDTDFAGFGIDIQRDLLRVAAGTPTDRGFAKFVAGRDSLTITCSIQPGQLPAKLAQCLRASADDHYRRDYEWVDNIQVVTDIEETLLLDAAVEQEIAAIRRGELSDLHICPPEMVDYIEGQNIAYFGRGFLREKTWYSHLDIQEYASELNVANFNGDLNVIKSEHFVHMHEDEATRSKPKWKVYDCFIYECNINDKIYVLYAGSWYRVSQVYKDRVNNLFNSLVRPPLIAQSAAKNEQELIEELNQRNDLLIMDKTKVNPRGVIGGNIEVCDFFSLQRHLIHLKDGHSSSSISHLWMQAVTSCDSLMSDATFRNGVRRQARTRQGEIPIKVGFENLLPPGRQGRVDTTAYTVIYGILRRRNRRSDTLDIPFFSKVSLQAPASLLSKYGYGVELHLIEKMDLVELAGLDADG